MFVTSRHSEYFGCKGAKSVFKPIGDRRPAPANLPALCPELRARLAAEGIKQVFLVQVTVLRVYSHPV
ncbi:hypothetical protein FJT64_012312 [Amphibalanus amphitrite]|uniref:Uncharacterized protein n=1 Tax=Amphibalanus amphitrite TaxID=1232801 RepID=A0A6A4VG16_AMPAM|nr:hypothetical protein FJT64_012312 [Amphibalanus amphitrite]